MKTSKQSIWTALFKVNGPACNWSL